MNLQFYKVSDFWWGLVILLLSVRTAVTQINFSSLNWYVEAAFTLVSLGLIVHAIFFKPEAK
ncbi:hypothetical protein [Lactiplantibacillus mudanjiangensis]|uniref:Uncharacterized protein n=1 Tax=Lactiplantibacillus mudanjiangensis TaxID=1296538 RepID=A0A660E3G9_9LACO|nr:hypothetical protein [Lactiplantibacillus mudanjiangensis]VDG20171.1 hypothetical protein [Lactobacillus pentosus] [Lactiplantibacillus mudanjiangensis]VDG24137.1 hypothetical protein [Lactobacillus pentosus] [Lactiplantibacillus mudanjiangensis]VDG30314.1 hypothetical protein [Lactobacillus pentosus] [Lactiplantibacillus mudanjiangensis]VDG33565.1 hypothetical protein [Lactobacillus pentosus] [Lactiplantibacillus mudanjiangensis]